MGELIEVDFQERAVIARSQGSYVGLADLSPLEQARCISRALLIFGKDVLKYGEPTLSTAGDIADVVSYSAQKLEKK